MICLVIFVGLWMLIYKNYKLLSKKEHKELLKLRNEEYIREASKNKEIIDLKEHLKWIEGLNENKKYFAVFYNGEIVGGVNFTKDKVITNWGIFYKKIPLIPIVATYHFINYMFTKSNTLYSYVLKTNTQALKINEFFGIRIIDENEKSYKMKLTKKEWELKQFKMKKIDYKFFDETK